MATHDTALLQAAQTAADEVKGQLEEAQTAFTELKASFAEDPTSLTPWMNAMFATADLGVSTFAVGGATWPHSAASATFSRSDGAEAMEGVVKMLAAFRKRFLLERGAESMQVRYQLSYRPLDLLQQRDLVRNKQLWISHRPLGSLFHLQPEWASGVVVLKSHTVVRGGQPHLLLRVSDQIPWLYEDAEHECRRCSESPPTCSRTASPPKPCLPPSPS